LTALAQWHNFRIFEGVLLFMGPDRFWQQVRLACKQVVRCEYGTLKSTLKPLIGENDYAMAA